MIEAGKRLSNIETRARWSVAGAVVLSVCLSVSSGQDLVIRNARIFDGIGKTIERGSIVVEAGRIVEVSSGTGGAAGAAEIDARGRMALPGLIDSHRHLLAGSAASDRAQVDTFIDRAVKGTLEEILQRGMTTIMSPGDHFPEILELRKRLKDGQMRGPRLLAVGPVFTAPDDWPTQLCSGDAGCKARLTAEMTSPEQARARVRELAAAGVDALKLVYDYWIAPDVRIADDVIEAIALESRTHSLRTYAHCGAVEDFLKLSRLGVRGFVHSPRQGSFERAEVARLSELGIPVATTVATAVGPSQWNRLTDPDFGPEPLVRKLENIRRLWDAGVVVAFGTDAVAAADSSSRAMFLAELRALSRVLSNEEVLTALTRNAAKYIDRGQELGTLEPGRIADIVLVNGDPLEEISDLMNVEVVIQGGRVVVDRQPH